MHFLVARTSVNQIFSHWFLQDLVHNWNTNVAIVICGMEWEHGIVNEPDVDDVSFAHNYLSEVREQNHRNTWKYSQQRPVALFRIILAGTNWSRGNDYTNRDKSVCYLIWLLKVNVIQSIIVDWFLIASFPYSSTVRCGKCHFPESVIFRCLKMSLSRKCTFSMVPHVEKDHFSKSGLFQNLMGILHWVEPYWLSCPTLA